MDGKRAVRALMLAGVGLSLSGCSMMRITLEHRPKETVMRPR